MKAGYKTIRLRGGARVSLRNTSKLDDDLCVWLVRFALSGADIGECAVHVKQYRGGRNAGRAYPVIPLESSAPYRCEHLIVARWDNDPAELVDTLAHEARHIEDSRNGRLRERGAEARARAAAKKKVQDLEREWNN